MLSYQHGYHAGNAADLHKHVILAKLWTLLKEKGRPLNYVDTHAGRGCYPLDGAFALKTNEAQTGIGKYRGGAEDFDRAIQWTHERFGKNHYPGSPAIIAGLANPDDHIYLFERHKTEFAALKDSFANHGTLGFGDGLTQALEVKTPIPRRGVVFIDPSYELKTEYNSLPKQILAIQSKWHAATVVIWYPLLEAGLHEELEYRLRMRGRVILRAMFLPSKMRMQGSAMMLLNAPFDVTKAIKGAVEPIKPLYKSLEVEVL